MSDFWFNDGNIIIVCGSIGFRVHRGILAFKSVKFRDIFAAGDANSGHNEMAEGCMVVRLPEDEKDMLRLLGVVYSSQMYFKGLGEPKLTFDIMHSLLQLATRYRFEELRADIIELLLIMFPSDRTKYNPESPPNVSRTKLDSIFAVEFGVTYHIPAILPAACYEVAMLGMEELFNFVSPLTPPGGHSMTLSPQALRICVIQITAIHKARNTTATHLFAVMDFQSPAKRSRVEIDVTSSSRTTDQNSYAPFSRTTSEFWFDDGNIIVVCGNTGFRIYMGLLAFKSVVFKDMLAVGDTESGCNEISEGCVVVRLPDDESDMLRLLEALYSPRKYFKGESKMSFDIMNSLLKLSTKYLFEELRADLIDLLVIMFPSERKDYTSIPPPNVSRIHLDCILAVEFGVTYNIPEILPVACYEVAMLGMDVLFDTAGSLLTLPNGHPMELSHSALRTCVVFLDRWHGIAQEALHPDRLKWCLWAPFPDNCQSCGGPCEHERQIIEAHYRLFRSNVFRRCDDYSSRSVEWAPRMDHKEECSKCLNLLDDFDEDVKDYLWLKLPYGCGYKDWEDIKQAAV
ncbi:hypothetical protein EWM64_g4089 [Hericium alpestre]|uniref:BTB domain-containing protein n=1 Tax=Hericium alpestre TaxID=135208 RepID=A0A4Z0A2I9_9AGAM|nr:hypothetical protein EWM64_g4089 [Hericium alpestre]